MPSGTDGLIAILEKREPLEKPMRKKQPFEKRILENKSALLLWNGCATGSKLQAWNTRKGNHD
jgi:hypothetical protein